MMTQDSPDRNDLADDLNSRFQQLQNGFQTAEALGAPPPPPIGVAPVPPPPPGTVLKIYLAPEYFFRKRCQRCQQNGIVSAYSEPEKNRVRGFLRDFSGRGGGCLVIAGSVFWLPAAVGPAIFGNRPVRNTMFVYYKRQLLLEYDKRNDCGELRGFEVDMDYTFAPGATSGTFVVEGLNCGVETCVDHAFGQLRRRDGQQNLDLQFVVSNKVTLKGSSIAVQGRGYVVHCNAGQFGANVHHNPFDDNGRINAPQRQADAYQRHAWFDLPWPATPPQPVGGVGGLRIVG